MGPRFSSRASARIPSVALAAALAAGAVIASPTRAQVPLEWSATPGVGMSYVDPLNWNPNTAPSAAANHAALINNGGIARVNAGDSAGGAWLNLGVEPEQSGHVEVFGGTLTLGEMRVGGDDVSDGGAGTFVQHAGDVRVDDMTAPSGTPEPAQSLYLGSGGLATGNTANGTYAITSGSLLVGVGGEDAIVVGTGRGAQAAFVHQGGSVTSTGYVSVGRRGATGTYTMSGGTLTAGAVATPDDLQSLWIGDGDDAGITTTSGTFTQTAGHVLILDHVEIGRRSGTGVYTISGGTLAAVDLIAGGGPAPEVSVARMHGNGTFNVRGAAAVTLAGNLSIGTTSGSITGGSNVGLVDIDGGSLELTASNAVVAIGNGFGAGGTLDVPGGSLKMAKTLGATSLLEIGRHSGDVVNAAASASGTLRVSGSGFVDVRQINVNAGGGGPANAGLGTHRNILVEGGRLDADAISFGSGSSRATRSLTITGGDVHIGFLTTGNPNLLAGGSAVTHISGGDVVIDSLEIFNGSTFRTSSVDRTLVSTATNLLQPNYRFGTAIVEVAGATTLMIDGPGNFGTGGTQTLTKLGAGALTINAPQTYNGSPTINVAGGTLNLNTNAGAGMDDSSPANLGIVVSGSVNFGVDQKLRALTIHAGASATVAPGGDKTLRMPLPNIDGSSGKLDMTDNDLIVDYATGAASPEFALRDKVLAARDVQSKGIFFTRTDDDDTILAFGEASELGVTQFNGFEVDNSTVLGKYTYYGDANFDGAVTTDDYVAVDLGLGTGDSWVQGDFDLNGVVTTDDYVVIDLNLGKGTPVPLAWAQRRADMIALHTAMFGSSYVSKLTYAGQHGWVAASVPEPDAIGFVGVGAAGLLCRRHVTSQTSQTVSSPAVSSPANRWRATCT